MDLEIFDETIKNNMAKRIWNKPFFEAVGKFRKKELLILLDSILTRISYENNKWHELDIKDTLFEEKCWLIETLNPNFFGKNEGERNESK